MAGSGCAVAARLLGLRVVDSGFAASRSKSENRWPGFLENKKGPQEAHAHRP
jgi:hypothetical protein